MINKYKILIAQKIQEHSENIGGPKVTVEPYSSYVDEAVALVNQKDPNILKNISDVRVDLTQDVYGQFNSSNPNTISVNIKKIENKVRSMLAGKSEEEIKKEIINQVAKTIFHESTHQKVFNESGNTSEFPAEEAERRYDQLQK